MSSRLEVTFRSAISCNVVRSLLVSVYFVERFLFYLMRCVFMFRLTSFRVFGCLPTPPKSPPFQPFRSFQNTSFVVPLCRTSKKTSVSTLVRSVKFTSFPVLVSTSLRTTQRRKSTLVSSLMWSILQLLLL